MQNELRSGRACLKIRFRQELHTSEAQKPPKYIIYRRKQTNRHSKEEMNSFYRLYITSEKN